MTIKICPLRPCSSRPSRWRRSARKPTSSSISSPAAPAASITRSASRSRRSMPRRSRTPSPRCSRPRLRSRISICCRPARARSPSRSAIRSPTPGRATPKSASRASSTSCARWPRSIRTTCRSPRSRAPASRRWPISRASGCRSARPSPAPSSMRAPSSPRAGMSYKDLGKVEYLPFSESVELMKNRQLDATLISAGLGVSAIRDLCASVDCVIVEISEVGGGQDGLALSVGADPGRHLQGQRQGRGCRGRAELSGHPLDAAGPGSL